MRRCTIVAGILAALAMLCAAGFAASKGPVGRWMLDEGSGQKLTDAAKGHPAYVGVRPEADDQDAQWVDGVLTFDGKNDCVTFGSGEDFTLTQTGTLAAWVRPSALPEYEGAIVIKPSNWYLVLERDGRPRFLYYFVEPFSGKRIYTGVTADPVVPLDEWTHMAVTFGRGAVRFYVNGYPAGARIFEGEIAPNTRAVTAGCEGADMRPFAGSIAGVSVYEGVLTREEIQEDLAETAPKAALGGARLSRPQGKGDAPANKSGIKW